MSSASKILPSQKFLADRRSRFCLLAKYRCALRLPTDMARAMSSCISKNASLIFGDAGGSRTREWRFCKPQR